MSEDQQKRTGFGKALQRERQNQVLLENIERDNRHPMSSLSNNNVFMHKAGESTSTKILIVLFIGILLFIFASPLLFGN